MTLTLSPRAVREAERCARWWHEHRPAARLLFDEELGHVLDRIRSAPNLGGVFRSIPEDVAGASICLEPVRISHAGAAEAFPASESTVRRRP